MERRVFIGFLIAVPLAATASAQAAPTKMSAEEIENLVSGNTIVGTWEGAAYQQYFAPDGTTVIVPEGGRPDKGRWRTDPETGDYESWWRSTGWTPYAMVRTAEGEPAWVNGDRLEPFRVLDGRQIVE